MKRQLISNLLGLVGAAVGGVVGFYTFGWLEHYGFYGLAIPGSFLGLGCGLLAQHRSCEPAVCSAASRRWGCRCSRSGSSTRSWTTPVSLICFDMCKISAP